MKKMSLLLLATAGAAAVLVVLELPEIIRYYKMSKL